MCAGVTDADILLLQQTVAAKLGLPPPLNESSALVISTAASESEKGKEAKSEAAKKKAAAAAEAAKKRQRQKDDAKDDDDDDDSDHDEDDGEDDDGIQMLDLGSMMGGGGGGRAALHAQLNSMVFGDKGAKKAKHTKGKKKSGGQRDKKRTAASKKKAAEKKKQKQQKAMERAAKEAAAVVDAFDDDDEDINMVIKKAATTATATPSSTHLTAPGGQKPLAEILLLNKINGTHATDAVIFDAIQLTKDAMQALTTKGAMCSESLLDAFPATQAFKPDTGDEVADEKAMITQLRLPGPPIDPRYAQSAQRICNTHYGASDQRRRQELSAAIGSAVRDFPFGQIVSRLFEFAGASAASSTPAITTGTASPAYYLLDPASPVFLNRQLVRDSVHRDIVIPLQQRLCGKPCGPVERQVDPPPTYGYALSGKPINTVA
jgi:hypothetical protein